MNDTYFTFNGKIINRNELVFMAYLRALALKNVNAICKVYLFSILSFKTHYIKEC